MTKAFQTFAKDVAQLLGATSYQGGSFAVDMLNFEKRLAEITPDPSNVTDPITSLYKLSVAELKGMSNTVRHNVNFSIKNILQNIIQKIKSYFCCRYSGETFSPHCSLKEISTTKPKLLRRQSNTFKTFPALYPRLIKG